MWFAQSPTPLAPLPTPDIVVEQLNQAGATGGLAGWKLALLTLYFVVCAALIVCVTLRTNKSEGLMQQSMSAPSQPTAKGKMTGEERLSDLTNNLAYAFLFLSMIVASVIRL
ncbi:MAG: preprotein translocase subunit SecG [Candidatus Eremiobacteraeota bacterium]|nr:preprotein translocase subunit SecG [Candidatus Eremiobacteraeota bacterium]MCW5866663.1 preprotein translocase subunit SecG [Candidatus Eremiobacteraeota bacterium]